MSNLLEVARSVSGHRWKFREYEERVVKTLMQSFGFSEVLAKILAGRGVSAETSEDYLKPTIRNLLPDPLHYRDMSQAAERLAEAVRKREKIAIFGDYDVDGATASSVLKRYFASVGVESRIYIPDRIDEGYGPNEKAITELWESGSRVLVTVDCGTVSYEPLAVAKRLGFDTIVVDHHMGGDLLPEAYAVINPNRMDETTEHRYMCAAGVSFMLVVAVNTKLREQGFFNTCKEPNVLNLLDLVALGTICDVMPLVGANRAFVSQGLKIFANRSNVGLAALADVSKLSEKPAVFHLGFVLGPRINAGGRIGEASLGARLLTTNDVAEAKEIAMTLNKLNEERRAIENIVEEEATKIVEREGIKEPFLMPVGYGWHQGVVGIVASRLKDRYYRPTAVVTIHNGVAKASARSITGVDLGAAVGSARDSGLLLSGGGHAMAAGFTFEESKLVEVKNFIRERLSGQVEGNSNRIINLDGALSVNAINTSLASELEKAAPFGTGNPEPRFVLANCRVVDVQVVGTAHIRCILDDGGIGGKNKVYAMAFRSMGTPLGEFLLGSRGKNLHIATRLRLSNWQGRDRVETQIDDAVLA